MENQEVSPQKKSNVLDSILWSDRYIALDNNHACANYETLQKLHRQGTDELVVGAWKNMLQLVGSRESLAGGGPAIRVW